LISANTEGPAKFITPGSVTVKIEGKSVHLLGEPMLNNCGPGGSPPNTGATMMGVGQGDSPEDKACAHPKLVLEEKNYDEEIEKRKQDVQDAKKQVDEKKKAAGDAQKALDDRLNKLTRGTPSTDSLRKAVPRAENALATAEDYAAKQERAVKSKEREKKVAEDEGGAKTFLIKCEVCGDEVGDFDVVTSTKVKEVKSSEAGYDSAQFSKLQGLVEGAKILGAGLTMKLAVPPGTGAQLEANNPELKGRVQEH